MNAIAQLARTFPAMVIDAQNNMYSWYEFNGKYDTPKVLVLKNFPDSPPVNFRTNVSFPNVSELIIKGCNKNFTYYYVNRRIFYNLHSLWIFSNIDPSTPPASL